MEEIEIVYFLLIFRGVTAVVYLYQLCSLRSRTIKSERDCSDYAMSGQHLVSVIIDTVLCYLLLHCDCQMSVRDTALKSLQFINVWVTSLAIGCNFGGKQKDDLKTDL